MLPALLTMVGLAAAAGAAAALAKRRSNEDTNRLIDEIDALLPQTQCGRCTFPGCRPYASALANGEADINQCPPGGNATAVALANLLGREPRPVDPRFGTTPAHPLVAWIDESACIGCVKCIQACPVDAIVGASKFMHTVIAEQCTGCELCIPPCPVDCIVMRPASA
jgi:electron transport complex protein RnfB